MNIIVQNKGGNTYYLNGKSEIPNNKLANITRALLLKSSNKKEPWCFAYQCDIWIPCRTENRLRGDVTYFLWHGTRPSYKHIKIWGLRVYIINVCVTKKKLDDISHCVYLTGYAATTGVIIYYNSYQPFYPQSP